MTNSSQAGRGAPRRRPVPHRAFGAEGDALMAEIAVERLLRRHGALIERDVPLPNGSSVDIRAERGLAAIDLHVKWLSAGAPAPRLGPIPRVLRRLERAERAIEVAIRWRGGAGCAAFERLVRGAEPFLRGARVGDERVVRDRHGEEIGAVRMIGPAPRGSRLRLVDARIFDAQLERRPRVLRLLRKAHAQFMPRSVNVILIVSSDPHDVRTVEAALLGTVIERWDRFPARGERVAHGRADDGFWSEGRARDARAVAWLRAGDRPRSTARGASRAALWLREGAVVPPATRKLLEELFGPPRETP